MGAPAPFPAKPQRKGAEGPTTPIKQLCPSGAFATVVTARGSREGIAIIVDIHSHTPRHRMPPSAPPASTDIAPMRPDKPNLATSTWDDYLTAMGPVDRAICFNIAAPPPGDPHRRTESFLDDAQTINNQTATFVRAHPDKLLGFLSVHPRDPNALDEIDRAVKDLG